MGGYDPLDVGHTTVADFDGVFVEKFMKLVTLWEAFVQEVEDFFSFHV
jgi:hypothetical protein